MKKIETAKPGFADYFLMKNHFRQTRLDEINSIIDWRPIEKALNKEFKRRPDAVGNPSYPPLLMFKCLILERLYNLSDARLEEQLIDSLSFLRFVGLRVEDSVPDSTTICRFRTSLLERGLSEKLLSLLSKQLTQKGLMIKEGVVVDATVIESARHPRSMLEVIPLDREESELSDEEKSKNMEVKKVFSDDPEAAWIKKGGKSLYGYKINAAVDADSGLIEGGHATPANKSDMKELPRIIRELAPEKGIRVYCDKGYTSRENRECLENAGLKDGIMCKAVRGKKLSHWEKKRNKLISRKRYVVERTFGNLKRNFRYFRSRYIGIEKVEQEFFLVAFAANLVRCVNLCSKR